MVKWPSKAATNIFQNIQKNHITLVPSHHLKTIKKIIEGHGGAALLAKPP
jgi:hypothetical protein